MEKLGHLTIRDITDICRSLATLAPLTSPLAHINLELNKRDDDIHIDILYGLARFSRTLEEVYLSCSTLNLPTEERPTRTHNRQVLQRCIDESRIIILNSNRHMDYNA